MPRISADGEVGEYTLAVRDRYLAADDVVVLNLGPLGDEQLPEWQPGAHIDVVLPNDMVRHYSLCGDPDDRTALRIAVLREHTGNGGSTYVHDHVFVGDKITIRGPRNHFPLLAADRYLFIAGGIGITPILTMAKAADAAGAQWTLHYGGRARSSMAFLDELDRWSTQVTVHPQDEVGLIDLARIQASVSNDTLVYCCGPEPLLKAVEQSCAGLGVDLHTERFQPKALGNPVPVGAFRVELSRTGGELTVGPDESLLDVMLDAGITVDYSCQSGTCGSCEVAVLEGQVDHRDSILTAAEQAANDTMYVCVSRAKSPTLIIDA